MNPAAHRMPIAEIFAPVQQVGNTSVRVFGFTERRSRDRSKRITTALRTQLAGIEGGSTALALPSPKARPLSGDTTVRGFTIAAATGAVTGSIPVLSSATDDVAGAYNWATYTDTKVLSIPVVASLFDSVRQRLVVADNTGSLRYRDYSAGTLGSWKYLAPSTVKVPGILHIIPMVNGYRTISRNSGSIYVVDFDAAGATELAKWNYATTDGMWFSSGPANEIYIAFQRAGGANYVLVFKGGVVAGFKVQALSGPVTTDPQSRPYVLVRDKLANNADSLVALDGTDWTSDYGASAVVNALSNP